jgi:hypothetical protein
MTGAGWTGQFNYGAGQALANAGLQVGSQKANIAQQGNQWIGQFGLTGAEQAGNAYEWGATGNAQGRNAGNNALWQGIGGAAGAIGGGLLNYWGGGGVSGNVPIQMPDWSGNPLSGLPGGPSPVTVPPPPVVNQPDLSKMNWQQPNYAWTYE